MIYKQILLTLPTYSYPIYVGNDLFTNQEWIAEHIQGKQVLIVTQGNIAQHYLSWLQVALKDFQCDVMLLPDGEQYKNLSEWQKIIDKLLQCGHERSTTLIALGGGVVGDMTGFAAACYQRGVNYIQIPTTLIAQVDSSIGGKTGVNHALAKNMLGAFYQPKCVVVDTNTLKSLPQREFISGLAEVVKYGLICDAEFFIWLEQHFQSLLQRDSEALLYAISVSAATKARIVSHDEKESGMRSLLNLGHTFGHALETACAYQNILHGEAVAFGMLMAAELSSILQWITVVDCQRIKKLLMPIMKFTSAPFQAVPAIGGVVKLLDLMKRDKKVHDGRINLILLKSIGHAEMVVGVEDDKIILAIERVLKDVS